jgi:hypothetical protein
LLIVTRTQRRSKAHVNVDVREGQQICVNIGKRM